MTAPRAKIAAFKRSEALAYRVPQACEISGYGKSKFYELIGEGKIKGIIHLTPDYSSGSYLLMQRAIPPQPRGGCYAR